MWFGRREERFRIIYEDNLWLSRESRSGPGSEIENTRTIRSELPALLGELEVQTLLDAPCGDFNWMRITDVRAIRYIGIDIVKEIIDRNTKMYGNSRREFIHCDLLKDPLPKADLIICRDCLIHFSFRHAQAAIGAFKRTGAEYLLTNTYNSVQENRDIRTGNWRPINLMLDPYGFPRPISVICESPPQEKYLALYKLQDLRIGTH